MARMNVAIDMRELVIENQMPVFAEIKALRASVLRGST